jgi:hypothetical protein
MGLFNNRKKLTQPAVVSTDSQVSTNTTNYFLDSNAVSKCTNHINEKFSPTACASTITNTNQNGQLEECCNDEVSDLKNKIFLFF